MAGAATTTASLATLMKEFYDKRFMERLNPNLRYDQFAVMKDLPKNEGKTVVWNRLTNLGEGYSLTEFTVPGLSSMSAAKVSATLTQKGYVIGISDLFDMTSISKPVQDAVDLLTDGAALTVDNYYKEEIGFGSAASTGVANAASATYLSARTQGFPLQINTTAPSWSAVPLANTNCPNLSAISVDRIRRGVTHLRNMNCKPFDDGYYVGIIHPQMSDSLQQDSNWITWNQYLQSESAGYKGEIGRVMGVRFVDSTNAMTSTVLASTWSAGASQYSAGGTLYGTLIIGKGAYGGVKMDGGAKITVVDFKADKSDPLGQYGTAGYKVTMAAKILNPSCGVILVDYVMNS